MARKVTGFRGGCAELMVAFENACVPVFTKVSSIELARCCTMSAWLAFSGHDECGSSRAGIGQ